VVSASADLFLSFGIDFMAKLLLILEFSSMPDSLSVKVAFCLLLFWLLVFIF